MSVPSDTTDSYWAKGTPPGPSFKFGIGGSDNNYEDYWKNGPEDNNSDNDD